MRSSRTLTKPVKSPLSVAASNDSPEWKTADDKGRVVLGRRFANRAVLIERVSDTEINLKLARVVPEHEAWLHENPSAMKAVKAGLAQARARRFAKPPNLKAAQDLIDQLEE